MATMKPLFLRFCSRFRPGVNVASRAAPAAHNTKIFARQFSLRSLNSVPSSKFRGLATVLAASGLTATLWSFGGKNSFQASAEANENDSGPAVPKLLSPDEFAGLTMWERLQLWWEDDRPPPNGRFLPPIPPWPYTPQALTIIIDPKIFLKVDIPGNMIYRRPGVELFFRMLMKLNAEVILFADEKRETWAHIYEAMLGDVLADSIDIFLFQEEAAYMKRGKAYKDLRYFNRDPSRVIMIDSNLDNVLLQPENVLYIPPYDGKSDDPMMHELMLFLEFMEKARVSDFRPILKAWQGKDLIQAVRKHEKEKLAATKKKSIWSWGS